MASWTDQPTQFIPYVQQLPVEAMLAVGVEKQRRYDEGIQKIQSAIIDRVAGLDIMRDVDKNLLKSKLSELDTNLRTVAAGDFSNYQLVNSIGRNIGRISSDENIQTAVTSTALARKEMARIEKDREEGTLDPSNEFNFNKRLNAWLNDDQAGTPFSSKYIPHFDVWKFARETFDAVKPDNMTFDQVYQLDENGKPLIVKNKDGKEELVLSPTMTRIKKTGRMPERVQQTLDQIFSDPRVSQQLSISGQYEYRGADSESLKKMITSQKDIILSSYDDAINLLNIEKSLGKDVGDNIERIQTARLRTSMAYDKYLELVDSDPDTVRGNLYKDDVRKRYTSMFGQTDTDTTVHDNPGWRAMFDMQKEANAMSRHNTDIRMRWQIHTDQMEMERLKMENDLKAAAMKAGGIFRDPSQFTQSNQSTDPSLVVAGQATNYENAANEFAKEVDFLIWETMLKNTLANDYKKLREDRMTDEGAKATLIEREAKKSNLSVDEYRMKWINEITTRKDKTFYNEAEPYIKEAYDRAFQAKLNFDAERGVQQDIADKLREKMDNPEAVLDASDLKAQTINIGGLTYDLSPQQVYDLSLVLNDNLNNAGIIRKIFNNKEVKIIHEKALESLARLDSAGLGDLARKMVEDFNQVNSDFLEKTKGDFTKSWFMRRAGKNNNWSAIYNATQKVNESLGSDAMEEKAAIIQEVYGVKPNLTTNVLTGDNKTDEAIVQVLSNLTGVYQATGNVSPDFKNFVIDTSNPTKNNLGLNVVVDSSGNPQIEIVLYDKSNKRIAGMTLAYDEAMRIGINPAMIYEPREVAALRNVLRVKEGQTSEQDPADLATYIGNFDYYYSNIHLPHLSDQSQFQARVNVKQVGNKYYPYIFMSDGVRPPRVVPFDGHESLGSLVKTIKGEISPSFITRTLDELERKETESNGR